MWHVLAFIEGHHSYIPTKYLQKERLNTTQKILFIVLYVNILSLTF
jgi:hypothetical protein